MRKCGNCGQHLPSSSFRENHRAFDGIHPNCISCQDDLTGKAVPPELRKIAAWRPPVRGDAAKKKLPLVRRPRRNPG